MTADSLIATPAESEGFTLIELLTSLLAGSLLLLWLGWAVSGISDQWARGAKPDPVLELAQSRLRIVQLIEGALYPVPTDNLPPATDRQLAFVTVPPRALQGNSLANLTLTVEQDKKGGERLIASWQDLETGRQLAPTSSLASGWRHIGFKTEDPAPEGLRPLVEIDFVARDGERFSILARPQISVEPDCEFDPISLECRQ